MGSREVAAMAERVMRVMRDSTIMSTGPIRRAFDRADAFVLAHGFAGVLRAMINVEHDGPSQAAIETALARMVVSFVG